MTIMPPELYRRLNMDRIFTSIKRITTIDQLTEAKELATRDQHDLVAPTHVVVKEGKVIGHVSIAGAPLLICHFAMGMAEALDTFTVVHVAEQMLELGGAKEMLTVVSPISPVYPNMKKMGYKYLGNVDLFVKEF